MDCSNATRPMPINLIKVFDTQIIKDLCLFVRLYRQISIKSCYILLIFVPLRRKKYVSTTLNNRHHFTKRRSSTISPLHSFTTSRFYHFTLSPLHAFTTSPLRHFATSPLHSFTTSPLHHFTLSPLRHFTTSLFHHFTICASTLSPYCPNY